MPKTTHTIPANTDSAIITVPALKQFSVLSDKPIVVYAVHAFAGINLPIEQFTHSGKVMIFIAPCDSIVIRATEAEAKLEVWT